MSEEENKAIVYGYMEEILNKGNFAAIDDYFPSEDFIFNGKHFTAKQIEIMHQSILEAFPDFPLTIEDQIAEGDKVVTHVTFYGTHKGEFKGIAPTGKQVKYAGIGIDRIAGGTVVEMWHEAG
ncbi:MAG: ester cyclase [Candidatus Methanofastidiosia archaeon]